MHNIGHTARTSPIYNDTNVMLAGGTEKASTPPLGVGGLRRSTRALDKDCDGFVLGDGAGIIVLEEYEHAKKHGAKIYAETVGFSISSDA